jgi:phenylalanyl-tRNA synthetase beta chain
LFEAGSRFTGGSEGRAAGLVWCGAGDVPHWSRTPRNVDFFDIKGAVEAVCGAFGIATELAPAARAYLVPGRAAEICAASAPGKPVLGIAGQLTPAVAGARGFPENEEVYAAELDTTLLGALAEGDDLRARPLPRHPSIVRDISILVDEVLPAAAVRGTIRSAAPATLASIIEFDRYQGKGVPEGRISLSLRLTFRAADRTLTDQEVHDALARILTALRSTHGAEQR